MGSDATFGERLRYVWWLIEWQTGEEPTQTALAEAVGRTQPAVSAWFERDEAPVDWKVHGPLVQFLGLESGEWLLRGGGAPPEPDLWKRWFARERHLRSARRSPTKHRKAGP